MCNFTYNGTIIQIFNIPSSNPYYFFIFSSNPPGCFFSLFLTIVQSHLLLLHIFASKISIVFIPQKSSYNSFQGGNLPLGFFPIRFFFTNLNFYQLMSTQSTFFPSPIPHTTSAFSLSKPGRTRTSTTVRARPTLSVFTSAKPHSFTVKPTLHKIASVIITNTSLATSQTLHDNSTSVGTRHSKTPSTLTRKVLAHCNALDEKAKNDTMGILELTSVQLFKNDLRSGMIDDGSSLKLTRTMTVKSKESPIKDIDGSLSARKERHGKALSLGPLAPITSFDMREIAKEAQSSYVKPSRNLENEVRQYIQKLRLLDIADARKIRMGGVNVGRRELAMTSRDYACNVVGLTNDERERLMALEIEDMDFFRKMEAILVESLKRIERLERLSEEIGMQSNSITNNYGLELHEGSWTRMDADRLEWRYCFVDLKGKTPPLKLCK